MSDAEVTSSTDPEPDDQRMGADDDVLSANGTVESAHADTIDPSTEPNPVEPNPANPVEPNPANPTEPNPVEPIEPNPADPVALNAPLA